MLLEHNYRYHYEWRTVCQRLPHGSLYYEQAEVPVLDRVTLRPKTMRGPWPDLVKYRQQRLRVARTEARRRVSVVQSQPRRREQVRGPSGRSRAYLQARYLWARLDLV